MKFREIKKFKEGEIISFAPWSIGEKNLRSSNQKSRKRKPAKVRIYTKKGSEVISVKPTKIRHTETSERVEFTTLRMFGKSSTIKS